MKRYSNSSTVIYTYLANAMTDACELSNMRFDRMSTAEFAWSTIREERFFATWRYGSSVGNAATAGLQNGLRRSALVRGRCSLLSSRRHRESGNHRPARQRGLCRVSVRRRCRGTDAGRVPEKDHHGHPAGILGAMGDQRNCQSLHGATNTPIDVAGSLDWLFFGQPEKVCAADPCPFCNSRKVAHSRRALALFPTPNRYPGHTQLFPESFLGEAVVGSELL